MSNLPALIILIVSFGGMVFIVVRKWPELRMIEFVPSVGPKKPLKQRIREKMAGLDAARASGTEKVLKRVLIKTKILFKEGERKADHYLRRVSHSQKFKDDYWGKIGRS